MNAKTLSKQPHRIFVKRLIIAKARYFPLRPTSCLLNGPIVFKLITFSERSHLKPLSRRAIL